jgi:hypothetical protein
MENFKKSSPFSEKRIFQGPRIAKVSTFTGILVAIDEKKIPFLNFEGISYIISLILSNFCIRALLLDFRRIDINEWTCFPTANANFICISIPGLK